jgi:adenosine deaminase
MQSTTNINTQPSKKSLSLILKEEPELYDLHAHLLGMGNPGFWIDTILMDELIMPKHQTFKDDQYTREALCPLIWDKDNGGFVNDKETARFFHYLIQENIFRKVNGEITETVNFEQAITTLKEEKFPSILVNLLDKNIYDDLIHGGLEFKEDFSYDVVLKLSDLGKGLGIKDSDCEGFVQLAVVEKLGCHLPGRTANFQHWIIFNARKQKFKIVFGIQVDALRQLILVDKNNPSEAAKLARAYINNAFSMCDAEGTRARSVDLHGFHGFFTPEFYPRRFALKDSIYSQRLDVIAALIVHITERYQTCLPPVKYCELSVSVNDLSKAWILDVLRSVRVYDQEAVLRSKARSEPLIYTADKELSSFSQLVLKDCFPHLQVAFKGSKPIAGRQVNFDQPRVTYKFLAGFNRRQIKAPFPVNPDQAVNSLYVAPHEAILLMMKEIEKSRSNAANPEEETDEEVTTSTENKEDETDEEVTTSTENKEDEETAFDPCLKKLKKLEKCSKKIPWLYEWVVGLDLFGDELGYPYCPFVARPFINFVLRRRNKDNYKYFGIRIHCGENVKFASDDNPAYRLFVAHMYIVFRCLLFLQQELKYGIRIGHGIAFDHILGANLNSSKYRKSSVLMAEMCDNAHYLFKKIAFEVNITSNEYLLGQLLRKGDYAQILRLKELFDMEAHITLGTDDDGIWPIDQCSFVHPGHQSLATEYCRAISTSLIDSENNLKRAFETMKTFSFWDIEDDMQKSFIKNANSKDSPCMNTVIVHPDIIRLINEQYKSAPSPQEKNLALKNYKIYSENTSKYRRIDWTNQASKLRVAFVCICASQKHEKKTLREEYYSLFGTSNSAIDEFNFIYDNWKCTFSSFVLCDVGTKPEIELPRSQNKQICDVIRSVHSQSEDPLMFLDEILWSGKEINIRAYVTQIDIEETKRSFNTRTTSDKTDAQYGKGTLRIFTNTKKYVFSYSKLDGNIIYQVNPNPSRREKTEENFLYVLCQHASAATAALHLISEQLSKLCNESPTGLQPILVGSAVCPADVQNFDNPSIGKSTPSTPTPTNSKRNSITVACDKNLETIDANNQTDNSLKRTYPFGAHSDANQTKRQNITK